MSGDMGRSSAKAVHALVYGRVQGVGFRYWARTTAAGLALTGWVRNLDNGSVELFFQGSEQRVDRFSLLLQKGPPGALVDRVEARPIAPRSSYTRFSITV